jgi:hypothetical protein
MINNGPEVKAITPQCGPSLSNGFVSFSVAGKTVSPTTLNSISPPLPAAVPL